MDEPDTKRVTKHAHPRSKSLRTNHAAVPLLLGMLALSPMEARADHLRTPLASVPHIGCPSDGQVGSRAAPRSGVIEMRIPQAFVRRLAFYRGDNFPGVLGPRGWKCLVLEGSNGAMLFVTPRAMTGRQILRDRTAIEGPGITLGVRDGATSGRFDVARIIARIFPKHAAMVRSVAAEGIEPATDFPRGPFPADRLTYASDRIVEYVTAPRATGLGTMFWLKPDDRSIRGVAILTGDAMPSATVLAVRLAPEMDDLTSVVVRRAEQEESQEEMTGR